MRVTVEHMRKGMLRAIHNAGFAGFQEAHFAIFSYPLPDGTRPSELARQKKISRQAANYLLGQLEGLDYVERRSAEGETLRVVHLTDAGWEIASVIFQYLRDQQATWATEIGEESFNTFLDVLTKLATKAQADDPAVD